jgi:histidyl-tRNA synthetase
MGDVVIGIVLKENGLLPEFAQTPAPILVTVFDESFILKSFTLAAELRNAGLNVIVYPEVAKLPRQFKFADKMKMKATLVLGPDEDAKGQVVVKNLSSGEQVTVARDALVDTVRSVIGG